DAAPLSLAAPEQGLDVPRADLPDLLPLEATQGASPPDPGHLEVVGGGLDLVGLDDLFPLLAQEAGGELPLARGTDRLLPAGLQFRGAGDLELPALIPQEPCSPRMKMDHLDPSGLRTAEVCEVVLDALGEGRRVGREQDLVLRRLAECAGQMSGAVHGHDRL